MKTFVLLITLLVLLPFFTLAFNSFVVYCPRAGKISFTLWIVVNRCTLIVMYKLDYVSLKELKL